ncbi:DUF4231 domain-containing protein [Streptomyces sp. HNM0574]|uniref:DUF4231 domain-containing protein n=1 Tax=Streptomyces sp. HNM0574 TaxID=2714954 RepID=UPI001469EE11|nr:DUF4231 domain-containing protein [Streptomyces sp. HNM0574]
MADDPIRETDLPALFIAADRNSAAGQRRTLRATRLRLLLLALAAVSGAVSWQAGRLDVAGFIGAAALATALVVEVYLLTSRPERQWYDGRAVAESVKSLSWRYLVGGAPLPLSTPAGELDEALLRRFQALLRDMSGVYLVPAPEDGEQITEAMRRCRALPLSERQRLYRSRRIADQRTWYATKAAWNERRATLWSLTLAAAEAAGITGGILKAAGIVDVDVLGICGAVVAAGAAWTQTKQHGNLARAYAVAAMELADIDARAGGPFDEESWARFVDGAEEAISREHRLWRATHA